MTVSGRSGTDRNLNDVLLAAIVESSDDAIASKTLDGVVTSWNPAAERLFGYTAGEMIGRPVAVLAAPGREAEMPMILERVRRGERVEHFDTVRKRKDGTLVEISLTVSPVRDARGRVIGASKIARDITERRVAERQRELLLAELDRRARENAELYQAVRCELEERRRAEAAGRAKSDFLAAMSHEIRTPMTGVLGMADLLAAADLPERERGHVEAIRASGRHLLAIVDDILDLARIEAGKLALERVDFTLAEVVEEVRSLMAPRAAERGLELRIDLEPGLASLVVAGDPTRLRQVLLNLVGNGLKFTHEGGVTVTVDQERRDGAGVRLRFEVRDTGIGIPAGRRAELFRAFAQAEGSTARLYGGTGLGLAISRRLVEAMGGTIGAESAPGEGSLFWFEVPLGVGDRAVAAERAAVDPASVPPLRILVVEDVEVNRAMLGGILGRHGHAVTFAGNGAEAVGLASRERFDAVLMDVRMPVMDGVEATRRIRRLPPPAGRVPIIGLTANVMAGERERYLAAGMDDCLGKPVDWGRLFAALARLDGGLAGPVAATAELEARGEPPGTATDHSEGSLLDRAALDEVMAGLPAAEGADLLRRVVDDVARSCALLGTLPAGSEEFLEEAHKLRGVARLFGLTEVGEMAAQAEAAARSGGDVAGSVERLARTVAATCAALREAQLFPA
jgi:PAS domain S-box-containing protein